MIFSHYCLYVVTFKSFNSDTYKSNQIISNLATINKLTQDYHEN